MKRIEAATCDRRRGKRMSIHNRTAMRDVVSKLARWDEVSHQTMNGKAVRRSGKLTGCIIGLLVDHNYRGRAGDIAQCLFIRDYHAGICIGADAKQAGGETGVDQACDAPALELMLVEHEAGRSEAQATLIIRIRVAWQPEID